jgi:DNA-binding NarL/FixJ family response regulator
MSRLAITPREVSMLHIAAQGLTQKHMTRELGMSQNSVKRTMSRLLIKLDAANTAQAVAKAVAQGLVKVDAA